MRHHHPRCLAVLLTAALLAGCGGPTADDSADDPRDPHDQAGGYAIAVYTIAGISHDRVAQQQAAHYRRATGLDGFWVDTRALESYVYFGRYDAPDGKAVQRDQAKLKQLMAAGRFRPHMLAVRALDPAGAAAPTATAAVDGGADRSPGRPPTGRPSAAPTGPIKANDLRTSHPDAIYTLQVSVYDKDYRGDRRRAAEAEAAKLRSQGLKAFFYHGPSDSLVTIDAYAAGAYRQVNENGQMRNELHPYIQKLRQRDGLTWLRRNGKVFEVVNDRTGAKQRVETGLVRIPGR